MNEKLNTALEQISDRHIDDAAKKRKPRRGFWFSAAAAALAAVILFTSLTGPMAIRAEALALAGDARVTAYPKRDDYKNREDWDAAYEAFKAEEAQRRETRRAALAGLRNFFTEGSALFLAGSAENRLWSPVNAAIGLAVLTELTGGTSRQQILQALGATDMDTLRAQVSALWESAYLDGNEASKLATSLWLETGLDCSRETLDALSHHHYTSVYRGDLGGTAINSAIGAWLNNNTGGLLKKNTEGIGLPEETVLALYSTLFFQSKWTDEFRAANNTNGLFHAPAGDTEVTFMNKKLSIMGYYWGENFSAVSLSLKNGSQMWLILPDEGCTTDEVLADGAYMDMISGNWENSKAMKVNLSVPKFDVTGTQNLKDGLEQMGVTEIFSDTRADFSGITAQVPVYLTAANQAVRVQVDEEGVKAAAYIEFPGATSPAPPDEIIDFVLDRPFLFFVTTAKIPLFAGAVNQP